MSDKDKTYTYKDNFLNFRPVTYGGGWTDPHLKYGKWRIDADDKGGSINIKAKRNLPKNWWGKLTGKK